MEKHCAWTVIIWSTQKMSNVTLLNMDCMEYMATLPDKAFELAIVDPPWGQGIAKRKFYGKNIANSKHSITGKIELVQRREYKPSNWDNQRPPKKYFNELFRVSKNQIIWGINYLVDLIPAGYSGRIVWDKINYENDFSDCELALTTLHKSVRLFRYMWNGMMQGKSIEHGDIQQGNKKLNEIRIHHTQKPVALYQWLLKNYAKQGDKILDTHGGSCSSAIACDIMGFDAVICEIDKDYYEAALERFNRHKRQLVMEF
jgi:site-specific DNA-methyltransferase (adenine-specific)